MTTLWTYSADDGWVAVAINPGEFPNYSENAGNFEVALFGPEADRAVALLVLPHIPAWVNGQRVVSGLKILAHQDEILINNQTWYYSCETTPRLTTFTLPEGQRRPKCGVCRVPIHDGETVVRCPRCNRVYHQFDADESRPEKHCFTYKDRCLCNHPTSLDPGTAWRPPQERENE